MTGSIHIAPYDPAWPERFITLTTPMRQVLGSVALRIDHIGSTAVPGLAAKPIIDIQISVTSFEPLDVFRLPLEGLGYVYRAHNDDLTKRYFRESPGTKRTHIHVRKLGSWSQQCALLFRDYLRAHPEAAKAYAALKYRLAADLGDARHLYTEAKSPLIWEIMQQANEWSQQIAWEPGPTDG